MTPLSKKTSTKINVGDQKRYRGFPSPYSSLPLKASSSLGKPLRKRTKMTTISLAEILYHILVPVLIVIVFIAVLLIISTIDDTEAIIPSVIIRLQQLSTTLPPKLKSENDNHHRYHLENNYYPTPFPTRIELLPQIELLRIQLSQKVHELKELQRQAFKDTKQCDMTMNDTTSKLNNEKDYHHRYLLDNNYYPTPSPSRVELLQHIESLTVKLSENVHEIQLLRRQALTNIKKCDMTMNDSTMMKLLWSHVKHLGRRR